MTKKTLPVTKVKEAKKSLPFNGKLVNDKGFSFSFACFDRTHELFNLGGETFDGTVGGKWFLDLLDCLKSISVMTIEEAEKSMHDLHRVDVSRTNLRNKDQFFQYQFWQFRINKSRGRVIGALIDGVFYIVWFDPHHNLTDSAGYGGIKYFSKPISEYEQLKYDYELLIREKIDLEYEIELLNEIMNNKK